PSAADRIETGRTRASRASMKERCGRLWETIGTKFHARDRPLSPSPDRIQQSPVAQATKPRRQLLTPSTKGHLPQATLRQPAGASWLTVPRQLYQSNECLRALRFRVLPESLTTRWY